MDWEEIEKNLLKQIDNETCEVNRRKLSSLYGSICFQERLKEASLISMENFLSKDDLVIENMREELEFLKEIRNKIEEIAPESMVQAIGSLYDRKKVFGGTAEGEKTA